jgi:hypothetical protein
MIISQWQYCVEKIFKISDVYGEPITFNIGNSYRSQTVLGGILTILTVFLLVAALWSSFSEIFERSKPNVNLEENVVIKRPIITLNSSTFPFGVNHQDLDGEVWVKPEYFRYEVIRHALQ